MAEGAFTSWVSRHGVMKAMLTYAARQGEPQARLMIDRQVRRNPYPVYDEVRRSGPLHPGRATYVTARHDVGSAVLRSDVFRVGLDVSDVPWFMRGVVGRDDGRLFFDPIVPPSLLASNPPDHTRYRRAVSQVFTPRAIAALEPRVEEVAQDLLDDLEGRGVVDLVETYASLLPVTVIAQILGVPVAMRTDFLRWGNAAAPALDVGLSFREYRSMERALGAMSRWMVGHIRALRADPGDDLLSQLIHTEDADGGRLSDRELLATAGLLLAAGFETTVNLLGSGALLLLTHPEQRERLAADPRLWGTAVDEILRYESPVQNTARSAREETEVAGVRIPAKGFVAVLIGGANRDPAVFEDPDRFDVGRHNARDHLSFSAGVHYCLGASLARAEGRIGLQALFDRHPGLALAGRPVPRPTRTLRGWQAVPVLLGQQSRLRSVAPLIA